ncbi:amino acid ABC transporter ATP-binding protein [Aquamicrobium defluvii]|uniref:Peptide ABC transporter ATP-binding protein n=1 Tax=Aquamicrobium defluvii TaxID=69279 RepID=A0A011V3H9_9HYPH|nr:amino acid ABC transporter ATP-binding protein [Aquamicrobium defluvii]EXL03060.1 peptide ABC transporter ATP-binding protein [Aquamicrobium defluvii]EZQ13381.1 peptide ABC transporter ATP-binding protein [Halopseudomonas bauzanensis]
MSKTILQLEGLEMAFGQLRVLRGVDLKVDEGESIAIIGPSGSGKSTLLRCLNRLETPTGGGVIFEGQRIDARTDINQLRTRMGMVFQQFNLFPHMTALANVMEAPVHVRKIRREQAEAEARRLLEKVGMLEKADFYPRQLSGGQKQRVAIARCLAMQPRLLLLDEITSALDPELVGEVLDVVRDLARQGMTMLLVTHEMRFAREFADRVVFMDGGVVVEVGPPEEIFTRPKSERLRKFLTAVLEQTT